MADYYTLLTNAGIAYETACKAAGVPIKLTQISVGDGGGAVYNPAATATALKREVWRGPLNALFQDEKNPSWLLAEVTIPPDVGGWYVREAGLWTDTGILYAIVKYPESFKPVLATSGSGKEFYIRSIFETSNASLVTLLIDDTVVKATRAWVMSYLAEELGKLDGKQSVRVAASTNIVLNGAQQIDGVAVVAGDRVLLANQTLVKDNGLWIVANGDWVRATDANTSAKVTPGLTVMVEEGTANGDSLWHLTTNAPITLGTTALTFKMLAGRTGIAAGTYKSLTVDEYGRATAGANPETLAGFGIKDSYTKAEVEALIAKASALPVGSIVAFPVDAPPPGFLELDNSVKSSATYPDLSAYLGGKFNKGDEGVGNFRLPEARGEFLRGWDHGRGVDLGRQVGSLQADDYKSHSHRYFDSVAANIDPFGGTGAGVVNGVVTPPATGGYLATSGPDSNNLTSPTTTVNAGGNETRPRNIAVMWCIKAWNAPVNQGTIDVAALAKEVERLKSAVPVGAVLAFPTGIVAPGYLELDGSVQSIATYPDLAAFLGTTYNKGDEGAGNFRLPDSRGEFLRGWDHGRGADTGRAIGSWQVGTATYGDGDGVNLPIPNLNDPKHVRVLGLEYDTTPAVVESVTVNGTTTAASQGLNMDGVQTPGTAYIGVDFMRSRPRNLAVMWCIKAWNAPINQGSIDIASLVDEVRNVSGRYLRTRVFKANEIYLPGPGTKKIKYRLQGGGGAGGGSVSTANTQLSAGCGGSAGAYAEGWLTQGFDGQQITLGKGGAGVVANIGLNGGTTSFAGIAAPGGYGGGFSANIVPPLQLGRSPNSELATGGSTINANGQGGGGVTGPTLSLCTSGEGGLSMFGPGGNPSGGASREGEGAVNPGAGGGGALAKPSCPYNFKGGNGGDGIVIIEEWT
ncbi:phage tail-collar fiber domain-containing protein [Pseudomonas sp. AM14(2022)]|uniref:phage tail-collar fiber domain-containing protein n=1 Tax=Pseudomonas sp. AM14(2022) TaxID=2983371 RepID=UPI002E823F86|nr:phage tail protein [Pseudomonas sp. AM14(2022)]